MMCWRTSSGTAKLTARRSWPLREWKKRVGWAATALGLTGLAAPATRSQEQAPDLTKMNIEELMNIDVTSVSKKTERLSAAPAAIFVVTGEEIRRGGFSCVPDALRMVPGMHVSQQSSHV